MVRSLEIRSAQWLLENPFDQPEWVIEDLIPCGLSLLAGAPKIGKSWLVLDLALHVSQGEPFWGFATSRGKVLYLCLEDTFNRVQKRLFKITDEAGDNLCFAVAAEHIKDGLMEQLDKFAHSNEKLRMVIVDTFQMVRTPSSQTIYSADYEDMAAFKEFADLRKIAVVVVHHTRKMGDGDVFNTISGSNGLMGSADTTLVLTKPNRSGSAGVLSVTGRDIRDQEYRLRFCDCRWELVEKTSEEELEARSVPEAVHGVIAFMLDGVADVWEGTATDLAALAEIDSISANVLSKYLNEHSDYLTSQGIAFSRKTTHGARLIHLEKTGVGNGGDDGND